MTVRNPARDAVAIVGIGGTTYNRSSNERTAASLAAEACQAAIIDAGVDRSTVDGVCGSVVPTKVLQASLGIEGVTWWADGTPPVGLNVVEAMNAVFSGACTTAVVYHANYRGPNASRSASADPFRVRNDGLDSHAGDRSPEHANGPYGYAAWADRYLQEFVADRTTLGRIAINSRTNAAANPRAVYRTPLTMDDYLGARMVREPLCLYDMDVPVDGADALVVTTAERARDLGSPAVLMHAAAAGRTAHPFADQAPSYGETGKEVAAAALWSKSELQLPDVEIFYPYDGFSNMAVSWFEALGWCGPGEAAAYLEENWDAAEQRLRLGGRILVNTHGGSLSEGGTQGCGHVREAVEQLRGSAGDRQVDDARTALVTTGGFLWNAVALVLRSAHSEGPGDDREVDGQ